MALDHSLLDILRCPVSRTPLQPLDKSNLRTLDSLVDAGRLAYVDGSKVAGPVREALITEDGKRIYLVDDGIPVLLSERAISGEALAQQ